ncbi:MAG TPA: hypothetical protein VFQ45_07595 [Longimicrobium sp.]|nr:hypothetical protein [Longimicrobium sp.]
MSVGVRVIAATLLLSFFACCVGSAILQLLAWNHVRTGQGPTLRGVWKPDDYFDEIGLRQMRMAKRLLILGSVAFVTHVIVLRLGSG